MKRIEVVHGELVTRIKIQKRVISACKVIAPTVAASVAAYLAGRFPHLTDPIQKLLALVTGAI